MLLIRITMIAICGPFLVNPGSVTGEGTGTYKTEPRARAEARVDCKEDLDEKCIDRKLGPIEDAAYSDPSCTYEDADKQRWWTCTVKCSAYCTTPPKK